jgi:hypothetical protein
LLNYLKIVTRLMLILAIGSTLGGALDSSVITLKESVLSMDLDPDFQVFKTEVSANTSGIFSYDMKINSSSPEDGRLFISVASVYDEVMKRMSPSALNELFLSAELTAFEEEGDVVVGNWSTVDSQGQVVNVHILSTENTGVSGGVYDFTTYSLGENTLVMIASTMGRTATESVIKTLVIE